MARGHGAAAPWPKHCSLDASACRPWGAAQFEPTAAGCCTGMLTCGCCCAGMLTCSAFAAAAAGAPSSV